MDLYANASIEEEHWAVEHKTGGKVTAAFLLLLVAAGLPWNLLVLVIILKKKLYKQPTIMLLLNLAVADLLYIFLVMPIQAVTGLTGEYGGSSITDSVRRSLCKAGIISAIFTFLSLFSISLLSFDRFLFIYKPLRYKRLITSFRMLLLVIIMWIVSILVASLPLFSLGEIVFTPQFLSCQAFVLTESNATSTLAYSIFAIVFGAIPILFMVVFDLWVVVIVLRNIQDIYTVMKSMKRQGGVSTELSKRMKRKRHERQLHLVKAFGGLLCCNMIAWLPGFILGVWVLTGQGEIPYSFYALVNIAFATQVVTHPLAETFLLKDVRAPVMKTLLCACFRKTSDNTTQSTSWNSCCGGQHSRDGNDETSARCGFLSLINAAILHQYPHDDEHGEPTVSPGITTEENTEL